MRRGFTLLELLVVVGIIAVLLALLIPAVQRVRESSNLAQCSNNLRQVGLALHQIHDQAKSFPSGGWGWSWVGMPDRGSGVDQPGNWLYAILPYVEQAALRKLGAGQKSPDLEQSISQLLAAPVPLFNCPSRRSGGPYPVQPQYGTCRIGVQKTGGTTSIAVASVARADYAGNSGSQGFNEIDAGPDTLLLGDTTYAWPSTAACSGIFFQRSAVAMRAIGRGTSNTFLVGERYVDASHYADGIDVGDNEAMYVGFDNDNCRTTLEPPRRDKAGYPSSLLFGSAHTSGVNMLYCDGSVRLVTFDVDPDVFLEQGNRN